MQRILITGGNGRMGQCLTKSFRAQGYDVVSTSRTPNEELDVIKMDVRDAEACMNIIKDVDTVIHLAYYMRNDSFREEIVPTNIIGTWNVYEAAVKNGAKRVIFCSSNHAAGFYLRDDKDKLREGEVYRADAPYGLSKCFAELCGRYMSDRFGISVINVRVGSFAPLPYSGRRCRTWLSLPDCEQLFLKCVEADEAIRFLTIYGVSGNTNGDFDISKLKDLIGYDPQDDGKEHTEHALEVDFFKGADDTGFLGAENVLFDPWTGRVRFEDIDELIKRHMKDTGRLN